MSTRRNQKAANTASDLADQVFQLTAILSALQYQLRAIQNGEAGSVHDEAHLADRVCRDVQRRLTALGEVLADSEVNIRFPEVEKRLEALL